MQQSFGGSALVFWVSVSLPNTRPLQYHFPPKKKNKTEKTKFKKYLFCTLQSTRASQVTLFRWGVDPAFLADLFLVPEAVDLTE